MTHRQTHFFEKLEFQVTTLAAVAAAFWLIGPALIPADPELPMTFLAGADGLGRLVTMLGAAALLGVACGAGTVTARPQTGAMALALGLAGLSFRSQRIRSLLWQQQDALSAMYWRMALEVVVLLAVVFVACVMAGVGRRIAASVSARLLWQDPLLELDEQWREEHNGLAGRSARLPGLTGLLGGAWPRTDRDTVLRGVMGFMISITVAAIVFFLLLRSPLRGQILFAVFAGCFLGVFTGQKFAPTRTNLTAWALPVVLGLFLYVLAAASSVHSGRGAWQDVEKYYCVLPIDWLTAGLGGAMLGHWEDLRMREARFIDESLEVAEA